MAQASDARLAGFDVEDLPLDVFDLTGSGLEVESLTAGHGMAENSASAPDCTYCSACFGGSCGTQCGATCSVQRPTFSQEAAY